MNRCCVRACSCVKRTGEGRCMVTDVGRGWISHVACRMELRAVAPLRLSLSRRYFHVGVVRRTVCNRRKNITTRGSGSPARTPHGVGHAPHGGDGPTRPCARSLRS